MVALLSLVSVYACVATSGDTGDDSALTPGDTSDDTPGDSGADTGPPAELTVSWSVAAVDGLTLAAHATVTANAPLEVAVQVVDPTGFPLRTAWTAAANEQVVSVLGLRAHTEYRLRPLYREADGTLGAGDWLPFTTGAVPSTISGKEFTAPEGAVGDEGVTLFAPSPVAGSGTTPYVLGVDGQGQLVYYYDDPALSDTLIANRNVRVLTTGELAVVLEGGFRTFWPTGATTLEISRPYLHHDAVVMPSGNVLGLVYEDRELVDDLTGETVTVRGDDVIEVTPDNELVWKWSSFDHLDPTRVGEGFVAGENDTVFDWTHANALDYDPDTDRVLVSMRNQNWVVVVDHATGEVLDLLGAEGTRELGGAEWFHLQHGAEFVDGGITVFDNGLDDGSDSRALRYAVADGSGTIDEIWSYDVGFYARTMGEVDALSDGSYLVTVGTADVSGTDASEQRGFVRLDAVGKVAWELNIAQEGRFEIFRAERVHWLVELSAEEAAIP